MKRLVAIGLCGVVVSVGGAALGRAQDARDAGGIAALEQQRAEVGREYASIEKKLADRQKAIDEQAGVVAARKAAQAAEAAFNDFAANNAVYAKLVKDRNTANAASANALEAAKIADAEYPELRKQLNANSARKHELSKSLQDAPKDVQEQVKKEMEGLDKQTQEINRKKVERRVVLNAKPEVLDAVKAAAAAESALQEFVKSNADYIKLARERGEAGDAFHKAMSAAQAADAEYAPLRKQLDTVRGRINEIDWKIAASKQGKPAK
jgi:hypothetical protein